MPLHTPGYSRRSSAQSARTLHLALFPGPDPHWHACYRSLPSRLLRKPPELLGKAPGSAHRVDKRVSAHHPRSALLCLDPTSNSVWTSKGRASLTGIARSKREHFLEILPYPLRPCPGQTLQYGQDAAGLQSPGLLELNHTYGRGSRIETSTALPPLFENRDAPAAAVRWSSNRWLLPLVRQELLFDRRDRSPSYEW